MAIVHQRYLRRTFRTPICSLGGCFMLLVLVVTLLLPFFLAYSSHGFWLKENTYREQPDVTFKHSLVLYAQGETAAAEPLTIAFATDKAVRAAQGSAVRAVSLESSETDENNDGLLDVLDVTATLPLGPGEKVYHVTALLLLEVRLREQAKVVVETMAVVDHSSSLPGRRLSVEADLGLRQRWPLTVLGGYTVLHDDEPLVDATGAVSSQHVMPRALLAKYQARNVTTHLEGEFYTWERAPDAASLNGTFVMDATFRVPIQRISYTPLVSEVLKVGWIQYLAMLVVVAGATLQIKGFVFENQILNTHVRSDAVKMHRL